MPADEPQMDRVPRQAGTSAKLRCLFPGDRALLFQFCEVGSNKCPDIEASYQRHSFIGPQHCRSINGRFGFLNPARNPQYRIFWDRCEVQISNFTNQSEDGSMVARLTGLFMGSGKTVMNVTARPNKKGPDIDLRIAIEDTDMRLMNDLFRSYGNFDVVAGRFSFFSDISVRDGNMNGYVKPLFHEMDVYDQRQDKEKNVFRKLYEGAWAGFPGFSRILLVMKSPPRSRFPASFPIQTPAPGIRSSV